MNAHKLQQSENGINTGDSFDLWNNVFCPYRIYNGVQYGMTGHIEHVIALELANNTALVNMLHQNMTGTTTDGHPCLGSPVTFMLHLENEDLIDVDVYVLDYNGGVTWQNRYKIWDGTTHTLDSTFRTHIGRAFFVGMFYEMPRGSTVYSSDYEMRFLPDTAGNVDSIRASVKQIEEINNANIPGYYDDGSSTTITAYKNYYQYEVNNKKRGMPIDDGNTVTYTVTKHLGNGMNRPAGSYFVDRGPAPLHPGYRYIDIYGLATPTSNAVIGTPPSDYTHGYRVLQPLAPPSGCTYPAIEKFIINGGEGSYTPEDPTIGRLCFRGFIILGE